MMSAATFPTLDELRESYRTDPFGSDRHWVLEASFSTYDHAEQCLHTGRWSQDQFEAFALAWAVGKISSEAQVILRNGAFSERVQYLADWVTAAVRDR